MNKNGGYIISLQNGGDVTYWDGVSRCGFYDAPRYDTLYEAANASVGAAGYGMVQIFEV